MDDHVTPHQLLLVQTPARSGWDFGKIDTLSMDHTIWRNNQHLRDFEGVTDTIKVGKPEGEHSLYYGLKSETTVLLHAQARSLQLGICRLGRSVSIHWRETMIDLAQADVSWNRNPSTIFPVKTRAS